MNDNASRARHLRTLHRFCGPVMCWQVRNANNSNSRAVSSPHNSAAVEAGVTPRSPASTHLSVNAHDAAFTGIAQ